MNKDVRELLRVLRREGYETGFRGRSNSHPMVELGDGRRYTIPSSPSDYRTLQNTCQDLGRAGLRFVFKGKEYGPA